MLKAKVRVSLGILLVGSCVSNGSDPSYDPEGESSTEVESATSALHGGGSCTGFIPIETCIEAHALQGIVNVRCFGAVGNGLTDDSNAIANAITCAAGTPGHRVYFPSGTYKVTHGSCPGGSADPRFRLGANASVVEGDGPKRTVIAATSDATCAWTVFGIDAGASATVRNLTLRGPGSSSAQPNVAVWHLSALATDTGEMTIDNVATDSFSDPFRSSGGDITVVVRNSDISATENGYSNTQRGRHRFYHTSFHDIDDGVPADPANGIYIKAPFDELLVDACSFDNISPTDTTSNAIARFGCGGVDCTTPTGTVVITGTSFSRFGGGISLESQPVQRTTVISGNSFKNFGYAGVPVKVWSDNVVITSNSFDFSNVAIAVGYDPPPGDTTGVGEYGAISGNTFKYDGVTGTAIAVELVGSASLPPVGWNINGNSFKGSSVPGVVVEGIRLDYALDTAITGNTFQIDGGPSVHVRAGVDRLYVTGNVFRGDDDNSGSIYIGASPGPIAARIQDNDFQSVDHSILTERSGVVAQNNRMDRDIRIISPGDAQAHPGWLRGTELASADTMFWDRNATIAAVTGFATINTIVPPVGFLGPITLIARQLCLPTPCPTAWALGSAGNIRASGAIMTNFRAVTLSYDGTTWFETGRGQ